MKKSVVTLVIVDVRKRIQEGFKFIFVSLSISVGCANAQLISNDEEYSDTEFGELLYNESSVATRLEVLELLSKDTPSTLVFLHAISMGLGIDDVLQAASQYEPSKARDFSESAISLLPLLSDTQDYSYVGYELEDIELEDDSGSYSIEGIAERFFEDRETLEPRPDWEEGEYHFLASVSELKNLQQNQADVDWYFQRDVLQTSDRPIFVSLYESDKSILIDGEERIMSASDNDVLPVVFIYNKQREQSVDYLVDEREYPRTIRGVAQAYSESALMVTPIPEWQLGDYHLQAEMEEIYELFDIPEEDDFEVEHWQKILLQAEDYKNNEASFLIVILRGNEGDVSLVNNQNRQYAQYTDPRASEEFPFIIIDNNDTDSDENRDFNLKSLVDRGLTLNRPDLIAALKAIGVSRVPVVFYYIDNARTKPYRHGPRALRLITTGLLPRLGVPGGGGGFGPPPVCASPPCSNQ